jgi:predicted DNA-binding WGR domain protein
MILHLEQRRRDQNRHDQNRRDQNRFRFYALDVCQDLFGAWCLWRRWGRIGTNGRTRVDSYGSEAAAVGAATDLTLRKQRRGYALLPEQLELPLWD